MANLQKQLQYEDSFDTSQDLKAIETKYLEECNNGASSPDTTFSYGCYLLKSTSLDHRHKGITLFRDLHQKDPQNVIYLYYLALGCYKVQDYQTAKVLVVQLLEQEPKNRQGLDLKELIEKDFNYHAGIGMAIVGGAAALVGVASILLIKGLTKKK